jgi:hypothetical protein
MTSICNPEPFASTLGGDVSLLHPRPEDIRMADVIAAMHHQVRYNGHTNFRVSILLHSILATELARADGETDPGLLRAILWHDAAEAYVGDVPRPLKRLLGAVYAEVEARFEAAVSEAFKVDFGAHREAIKEYDNLALAVECRVARPPEAYATWTGLPPTTDKQERLLRRLHASLGGWVSTRETVDVVLSYDRSMAFPAALTEVCNV